MPVHVSRWGRSSHLAVSEKELCLFEMSSLGGCCRTWPVWPRVRYAHAYQRVRSCVRSERAALHPSTEIFFQGPEQGG